MDFLYSLEPWLQTLILTLITWLFTTLGATMVFFVKKTNKPLINFLLALSAGIMIASSIFSLIMPALEQSTSQKELIICCVSVFLGGLFVVLGDIFLDKIIEKNNRFKKINKKNVLLVFAISLHNIPEGMSIGVMVASIFAGGTGNLMPAIIFALGIALQNFPEGASVSLPLVSQNMSKNKAFLCGMFSGIVEPIFAIVAFFVAMNVTGLLTFLLTFSAGTMICVACIELISEAVKYNKNMASVGLLLGFFVMMIMDILL